MALIDNYILNLKNNIKNEIETDYQNRIKDTKRINFENIIRFLISFIKDDRYNAFFLVPNRYQRFYENVLIKLRENLDHLFLKKIYQLKNLYIFP